MTDATETAETAEAAEAAGIAVAAPRVSHGDGSPDSPCGADPPSTARNLDWYTQGVVYQIFPDRYRRDEDWRERTTAGLRLLENGPERILAEDWSAPPHYAKNERGNIVHWDFYGGSLRGITGDLDRIAAAGFSIIYLNPIFRAASNHRYDTADYLHVDPVLGTDADFEELCREATARGISIILDGVFAHTGRDSRYFNRFGNFPETGAWQAQQEQQAQRDSRKQQDRWNRHPSAAAPSSPYRDWYTFHEDGSYDCWNGIEDLPALDLSNPAVLEFLCGEDGVLRRWIRAGARGWRLDAADKLSDEAIARMRRAVLAERPDAVLIGEIWADAMQPDEQGIVHGYFDGRMLDGVTNYPQCCLVREFLCGQVSASHIATVLNSLYERYSPAAYARCLNMIGSHDMPRILSVLGGGPTANDALGEDEAGRFALTPEQRATAVERLRLATFLQFCLPGVPVVYAGDEAGVEGLDDPYNRASYPWGAEDEACLRIHGQAIGLRQALPVLVTGDFRAFAHTDDVFGFRRTAPDCSVTVLANRNLSQAIDIELPFEPGEFVACDHPFCMPDIRTDGQRRIMTCSIPPCSGALICIRRDDVPRGGADRSGTSSFFAT